MGVILAVRSQVYSAKGVFSSPSAVLGSHMFVQTAEIIALLYESTQTPSVPSSSTEPMNPTVGVRPRGKFPEALRGLMFRKDPSQPGGGVFVAAERPSGDYSDLPKGTIVLKGDSLGQGVPKEASMHGGWI
jgi:hypothetical protein